MKTIEDKIREAAHRKVSVTITNRTRSTHGFTVEWVDENIGRSRNNIADEVTQPSRKFDLE